MSDRLTKNALLLLFSANTRVFKKIKYIFNEINASSYCRTMLRRLFNTVIETSMNFPQEATITSNPFTKPETSSFGWLTTVTPCFPINCKNITILHEPKQFYEFILNSCNIAKERITLASLYIGHGSLERQLIANILNNGQFINGNLKVNVLLDYTRGSRFKDNSRKMLKPLLEDYVNCTVSLYHTPDLRGLKKKFAPNRWNELFGLQHMKLYIFDDVLVISGANLSNDYFTNRQDRYYVIKDKNLCDFYCGLVKKVQEFSFKLDKSDNVRLNENWGHSPYEGSRHVFTEKARELISDYLWETKEKQNCRPIAAADTWVFPCVQMGQLGIKHDSYITEKLLRESTKNSRLFIATGYFNLTDRYMDTILSKSQAECKVLMAHPDANGFKGAKGAAGGIPAAYCLIADKFRKKIEKLNQTHQILLYEYFRKGWTFHVKGLWYYPPGSDLPCLTLIGSPNFGERSVKRDLETQVAIVTENEELRRRLHEECQQLFHVGELPERNRIIPAWVHVMVALFRGYF